MTFVQKSWWAVFGPRKLPFGGLHSAHVTDPFRADVLLGRSAAHVRTYRAEVLVPAHVIFAEVLVGRSGPRSGHVRCHFVQKSWRAQFCPCKMPFRAKVLVGRSAVHVRIVFVRKSWWAVMRPL